MARSTDLASFVKHLERWGPEGVLEAAGRALSEHEYNELEKLVAAAQRPPKRRRKARR